MKNNIISIQLKADEIYLSKHCEVTEAFDKNFQTVYNNFHSGDFPFLLQTSVLLSLASIFNSDVCKALKCLRPSESVGLDDIPAFIIKGWSEILYMFLNLFLILAFRRNYILHGRK
jgi:hypothetical protein